MSDDLKTIREALVYYSCDLTFVKDDAGKMQRNLTPKEYIATEAFAALDLVERNITKARKDALEEAAKEAEMQIYDCCHSMAQPSMSGRTWGSHKDYLTEHVCKTIRALIPQDLTQARSMREGE